MTVAEIVRIVVQRLEAAAADYQIVGAIAYFLYGPPRFTADVDFVVRMPAPALDRVLAELPAPFEIDPQARMEQGWASRFAIPKSRPILLNTPPYATRLRLRHSP